MPLKVDANVSNFKTYDALQPTAHSPWGGRKETVVTGIHREILSRRLIPSPSQLYRLERYDDCLAAYRDLIRNSQDEYEEERKTNLSAVVAAQSTWEKVMPVSKCVHVYV